MIGRTLSHYRILERLGEGGMGEVYLAEDLRLQRPVALKMLPACRREQAEERARLLAEARLASALNHPNIAVVYEVDEIAAEDGPLALLAMEYVSGTPLDVWAKRARPGLDRILEVAEEIAAALAHAHAHGIVHRDVKPSNLIVADSGRVKVLDFGLARRPVAAAPDATTASRDAGPGDAAAGTMGYMAPEQLLGRAVDARADHFAFGIVLYELVAGVHPFAGATAWEIVAAVLHRPPPPLPLPAEDPRSAPLAALLERLLAKDPAARPADLAAVARELAALRRLPDETLGRFSAGAGIAVVGFENLTGDGEDDWIGAGLVETLAADLARLTEIEVISRERVADAERRLAAGAVPGSGEREVRLGRALGARYVVAGAVQRLGETVRVTLRLVDLTRQGAVESWRFDEALDRLFALQDRAVAELARRLSTRAERAAPEEETTVVAAFEALSRGMLNVRAFSFEGLSRAIAYFERAVALDPGYARAHCELANALADLANLLVVRELFERALSAAVAARRLRPDWARPHREVGSILVALGRDEAGIESLERALALAPEDATVLSALARAHFLGRADFAAAARGYERSLAANPHGGWSWLQLAHCRTLLGELAPAREAALRAVELQERLIAGREGSRIVGAHMRLGHVAAREGRWPEALESLQREVAFIAGIDHALRNRISVELHLRLGAALQALGRHEEAQVHFASGLETWEQRLALGADEPFTRFYAAAIHALAGEAERALADLERCAVERPRFTLARLKREPDFASLAGHPRFLALLGRVDAV